MNRLAGTLVAFLWQGALVAVLLAAGNLILRKASTRYAAACAALGALLLFPVVTFWRLASTAPGPFVGAAQIGGAPPPISPAVALLSAGGPALPRFPADTQRGIVLVWLAGVLVFSVRLAGNWAAAETLRRRGVTEPEEPWAERVARIARRMGLARPVRLLASTRVTVPAAFGVLSPVILVPVAAFTALPVRSLEALLAHELAHIRRHDYLVNLAQSLAEALFFYHPAVWWVSHRLRVERENACDDMAVLAVGSVTIYARALLDLEETRPEAPVPSVAANGSTLSDRVFRLLLHPKSAGRGPRLVPAAIAAAALAAVYPAARPRPAEAAGVTAAAAPRAVVSPSASPRLAEPVSTLPAPEARVARGAHPVHAAPTPPATGPAPLRAPEKPSGPRLSPEQLISFRIHGVTPEFIEEIRALGFSRVTADELTAMRIHGVTPDFVRATRAEGLTPTIDEMIEFRIHGVTRAFIRELGALGYTGLSSGELVSMRIHGVTPDFIRKMNRFRGQKLSVDDLVGARIHGIEGDDR
jgi:beta-lactamase regulating signal transducer with metallopeptidase domain